MRRSDNVRRPKRPPDQAQERLENLSGTFMLTSSHSLVREHKHRDKPSRWGGLPHGGAPFFVALNILGNDPFMAQATSPSRTKRTKLRPELTMGEPPEINRHWRGLFLASLAETSNVTASAKFAQVNPSRPYKARRDEPEFAHAWKAALLEGYEHLEMETLHRLRMGTPNGKDDRKFDIANALRLLMLHRETIAKERAVAGEESEESVLASLNAKIDAMRSREAEVQQMLREDNAADADVYDDE